VIRREHQVDGVQVYTQARDTVAILISARKVAVQWGKNRTALSTLPTVFQ
jgi:hypothetical protein